MDEFQSTKPTNYNNVELLYFWALGDLHYCAIDPWQPFQTQRLTSMVQDLRTIWAEDGEPAFCVSPGESVDHLIEDFTAFWGKPVRYYWVIGEVLCIMLDPIGYPEPYLTQESLIFLQTALAKHPRHTSIIFCHCPLYDTVLDRDPERNLDYHSLDPFFYLQNSAEVRAILARFKKAGLFLSGHTHSGWGAPNIVYTEGLGDHPVTSVNLMSPWYTGYHKGASLGDDGRKFEFHPDDPDMSVSFAIRIFRNQCVIQLRDHMQRRWMAEWIV